MIKEISGATLLLPDDVYKASFKRCLYSKKLRTLWSGKPHQFASTALMFQHKNHCFLRDSGVIIAICLKIAFITC